MALPGQVPRFRGMDQVARRIELSKLYAGVDTDPESEFAQALAEVKKRAQAAQASSRPDGPLKRDVPAVPGWPFDAAEARRIQETSGASRNFLRLRKRRAARPRACPRRLFSHGDPQGPPDSRRFPQSGSTRPFYMGRFEITNRQYQLFDPRHDSRYIDQASKDHYTPGYPVTDPINP